jgi:hypothetical protein
VRRTRGTTGQRLDTEEISCAFRFGALALDSESAHDQFKKSARLKPGLYTDDDTIRLCEESYLLMRLYRAN